jgi:hypothetical protein
MSDLKSNNLSSLRKQRFFEPFQALAQPNNFTNDNHGWRSQTGSLHIVSNRTQRAYQYLLRFIRAPANYRDWRV